MELGKYFLPVLDCIVKVFVEWIHMSSSLWGLDLFLLRSFKSILGMMFMDVPSHTPRLIKPYSHSCYFHFHFHRDTYWILYGNFLIFLIDSYFFRQQWANIQKIRTQGENQFMNILTFDILKGILYGPEQTIARLYRIIYFIAL